jgi:hypothetical protein
MDETSIRMTIVVNPLVTPLLFEQLQACKTARSRATRLKALAEASLRQQLTGRAAYDATPAKPSPTPASTATTIEPPADDGFQVLRTSDVEGSTNEDESGSLANAFAGYFD